MVATTVPVTELARSIESSHGYDRAVFLSRAVPALNLLKDDEEFKNLESILLTETTAPISALLLNLLYSVRNPKEREFNPEIQMSEDGRVLRSVIKVGMKELHVCIEDTDTSFGDIRSYPSNKSGVHFAVSIGEKGVEEVVSAYTLTPIINAQVSYYDGTVTHTSTIQH